MGDIGGGFGEIAHFYNLLTIVFVAPDGLESGGKFPFINLKKGEWVWGVWVEVGREGSNQERKWEFDGGVWKWGEGGCSRGPVAGPLRMRLHHYAPLKF